MAGLGQPKTGGREKGTPNKSTQTLAARMDELREQGLDVCPIQVLMEIAAGKKLNGERILVDESVRVRAAAELCSYIYPKRKAVEVSGADGTQIVFAVVQDQEEV
jgi:hypothetical protein